MDFALCECAVFLKALFGGLVVVDEYLVANVLDLVPVVLLLFVELDHTDLLIKLCSMLLVHPFQIAHLILGNSVSQLPLRINLIHALHDIKPQTHSSIPLTLKIHLIYLRLLALTTTNLQPLQIPQVSIDLVHQTRRELFLQKAITCLVDYVELVVEVPQ